MRSTRAGRVQAWAPAITTGILLALCQPAHADKGGRGERLVIFPMRGELPDADSRVPATLTRTLQKVTDARGMKVTMLQVSLEDTALMAGCESAENVSCHELILGQLDADSGMTSEVAPTGEGKLKVTVRYFDGKSEPTVQSFEISEANADTELEGAMPALFGEPVAPTYQENVGPGSSGRKFDISQVRKRSWMILGGGGALMGAGTIFWLTAAAKQGEIDGAPVVTAEDLDRLESIEGNAKARATIGNVLFFSGMAVAAVGGFLAVRQALSSGPATQAEVPPASTGLRFTPVPMPDGIGVTFSMEWQ